MALIKNTHRDESIANAVVLDLGDLARQGQILKERARAEADQILAQAREERKRIVGGATETGHDRGYERGLAEGTKAGIEQGRAEALQAAEPELTAIVEQWSSALEQFEGQRGGMLREAKGQIIELAAIIARRVTKRAVELDERVIVDQLGAVLERVSRPTRLVVAINPEDEPLAREVLPDLVEKLTNVTQAELKHDSSLSRGSCVARTGGGGEIDGSIDTQIDRLVSTLVSNPGDDPGRPT